MIQEESKAFLLRFIGISKIFHLIFESFRLFTPGQPLLAKANSPSPIFLF